MSGTSPGPLFLSRAPRTDPQSGPWVADRFFASELGDLGTVTMELLVLRDVLKCQGITRYIERSR